jgi:RNA polymerase sigma-70 factor (ECF subfamily)
MTEGLPDAVAPAPDVEERLVRRAREGDLDAFNALVETHQRAVYNLCLRMIGSPAAADDATQEAFLSAWRALHSFRGGHFRAWLMRISANACRDELRRRGRRPSVSLDATPPGASEPLDPPDPAPGPEALALRSERQAQVQEALAKLPEDQRLAVVLCDVQGYAYEEIALVMHCSLGTVKSRIARGREKLRVLLVSRMEQMSGHERP